MDKPDLQSPKDTDASIDKADNTPAEQPRADALGNTEAPGGAEADVFPQLDTEDSRNALAPRGEAGSTGINAMLNVGLDVQIVLGQARMPISRLLELTRGSIVELNRKIGAPVDLMVSDRLVARGDLVKVGEDRLGVSLTQIVKDYAPD
ncbi:FliM/FliN family flagellar motor switch protein [Sulfitobacter sp. S0837]|uniref:FliM/FliN family flagellar motor switch protein n=1 Tax=Sulfitobacter maritimus TaxID=2741719 RepID=UPI0015817B27|nr:FliM/FliN family flagellar motor switch protein [Sulfitobacter maritimus]NUH64965.1 FliM/FliN family flagellar motor switch protein [Sulfitobacter maritimus]